MLDRHIRTFNENIIGLRDFIKLIGPFIEEHHKNALKERNEIVNCFRLAKDIATGVDEIKRHEYEAKIRSVFDGELITAVALVDDENEDHGPEESNIPNNTEVKAKFGISVPAAQNGKVRLALHGTKKTGYHKELLYRNAFIGLLSSVEWFYSQVLHYYYDKHPDAAGIKKKNLTLEDLKGFKTIEDAEKYLIDSKIEEVFRSGFDAWMELLRVEIKLKMPYLKPFLNELMEVYQRRNLLVHNGGIVNSIYISKVPGEIRKGLRVGDKLSIDSIYLEGAIQKLQIVFTLIAAELWKKLQPTDEDRAEVLNVIAYENMRQNRWLVSEWLCDFIQNDEKLKSVQRTVGQLNYWLSKKKNGEKTLVENEVAKADFTDKSLRYQLAVAAIKDDKKEFFELLPETIRTDSLEVEELLEFPIFEEMRDTTEFETFKNTSPEFKALKKLDDTDKNGDLP